MTIATPVTMLRFAFAFSASFAAFSSELISMDEMSTPCSSSIDSA